jgi:hypothetical protein
MKKKNTFSTLVLELFFPSIANCKKLKIKNIQKLTSPTVGEAGIAPGTAAWQPGISQWT